MSRFKLLLCVVLVIFTLVIGCQLEDKQSEEYWLGPFKVVTDGEVQGGVYSNNEYMFDIMESYLTVYKLNGSLQDKEGREGFICQPIYKYFMEGVYLGNISNVVKVNLIPVAVTLDDQLVQLVIDQFNVEIQERERFINNVSGIKIDLKDIEKGKEFNSDYYKIRCSPNVSIVEYIGKIPNRLLTENTIKWYIQDCLSIEESKREEFFKRITGSFFSGGVISGFDFSGGVNIKFDGGYLNISSFEDTKFVDFKMKKLSTEFSPVNEIQISGEVFWILKGKEKPNFGAVNEYGVNVDSSVQFEGYFYVYKDKEYTYMCGSTVPYISKI